MPARSLDQATLHNVAQLLAAETDDFNALVRLAGLDPARDFRHTDVSGTSMAGADLRGFDFSGADFRNVDLYGAKIHGSCFKGADLSGTDLSAATGLAAADCSFAVFKDAPFAPEMVVLPQGSFLMGSPKGEAGRHKSEGPQRQVTVASFAIGRYPVTFADYDHFRDATGWKKPDDRNWGRARMPVINVSWSDALAYTIWLTNQTGKHYRLPSEAEWEYACRAGTTTAYWWGADFDPKMANTVDSDLKRTVEVGNYPANPWGLFDMPGTVWEWVEDHWHKSYRNAPNDGSAWFVARPRTTHPRVVRGGSWNSLRYFARCANRDDFNPSVRVSDVGFRIACSSPS